MGPDGVRGPPRLAGGPLVGRGALQRPHAAQRRIRLEAAQVLLHQRVLAGEVLVEGAFGYVGLFGEALHAGGVDTLFVKQPGGGPYYALACAPAAVRLGFGGVRCASHPQSIPNVLLFPAGMLRSRRKPIVLLVGRGARGRPDQAPARPGTCSPPSASRASTSCRSTEARPPQKGNPMNGPISRNRLLGSPMEAASWPGADRNTVVTLATALVAARADAEGSSYFQDLAERNPADATAQALAGFFAVRAGHDVAAAITTLDKAATTDLGLPQYFRGLALAGLLPGAGPSGAGPAAADTGRADQVIADLEFVLAVRDPFPVLLLRPGDQGLGRADPVSRKPEAQAAGAGRS